MKKIIQITEDIAIYADKLQFIKKTKKGKPSQPYYENRYFATLEDCLEDVYEDLLKTKLADDKEKELKNVEEAIREAKEEIKIEIESSNQL